MDRKDVEVMTCCCKGNEDGNVKHKQRDEQEKKALMTRLSRIEGQVRGIRAMVEDDRYCASVKRCRTRTIRNTKTVTSGRCPPDESSPKRHALTRLPPRCRDSPTRTGYFFWSSSLVSLSEGSLGTSIALQWHTATAGRHARRRKCRIRCYGKDTRGCKGVK